MEKSRFMLQIYSRPGIEKNQVLELQRGVSPTKVSVIENALHPGLYTLSQSPQPGDQAVATILVHAEAVQIESLRPRTVHLVSGTDGLHPEASSRATIPLEASIGDKRIILQLRLHDEFHIGTTHFTLLAAPPADIQVGSSVPSNLHERDYAGSRREVSTVAEDARGPSEGPVQVYRSMTEIYHGSTSQSVSERGRTPTGSPTIAEVVQDTPAKQKRTISSNIPEPPGTSFRVRVGLPEKGDEVQRVQLDLPRIPDNKQTFEIFDDRSRSNALNTKEAVPDGERSGDGIGLRRAVGDAADAPFQASGVSRTTSQCVDSQIREQMEAMGRETGPALSEEAEYEDCNTIPADFDLDDEDEPEPTYDSQSASRQNPNSKTSIIPSPELEEVDDESQDLQITEDTRAAPISRVEDFLPPSVNRDDRSAPDTDDSQPIMPRRTTRMVNKYKGTAKRPIQLDDENEGSDEGGRIPRPTKRPRRHSDSDSSMEDTIAVAPSPMPPRVLGTPVKRVEVPLQTPKTGSSSLSGASSSTRRTKRSSASPQSPYTGSPPRIVFSNSNIPNKTQLMKFLKKHDAKKVDAVSPTGSNFLCVGRGELKRTSKLTLSVALGKMLVTDDWVTASSRAGHLLDPSPFFPSDPAHEALWQFSLPEAVKRGKAGVKVFHGWTIYITRQLAKDVKADGLHDLKEMAKAAGAEGVKEGIASLSPREVSHSLVLVASERDRDTLKLEEEGWTVFSREILSLSMLRGRLDVDSDEFRIMAKAEESSPDVGPRANTKSKRRR
ncbi:MAG: hypothetical protein M1833_000748 [Piccolia ochrophora]|nr:MAG: hypothetical protein M1833_000748 [Piccolia ochrophora]